MADIYRYLYQWLDQLALQQHSTHTLEAYHRDVDMFLKYCQQHGLALQQLEKSDLGQYHVFRQ